MKSTTLKTENGKEVIAVYSDETSSYYWYEGYSRPDVKRDLYFTPVMRDGSVSMEDWGIVEEALVSEEVLENGRTLGQVYEEVRKELDTIHYTYFCGYSIVSIGNAFLVETTQFYTMADAEAFILKQEDTAEFAR